jgi:hypothetical protein
MNANSGSKIGAQTGAENQKWAPNGNHNGQFRNPEKPHKINNSSKSAEYGNMAC